MNNTITKTQEYSHSISEVWNAITNQNEISTWFLQADFKAEIGYNYTFTSTDEDCEPIIGTVKKATPYELEYTWQIKGTDVESVVTWKLEPSANGTLLTLTHTGISAYKENAVRMFESFNGGWDNCISGLTSYLSKQVHV